MIEDVFDLLNAGPNHRFTVRTSDGGSMIVSNCIQAFARDLMVEAQIRLEDSGYGVTFTVHDEICAERMIGEGSLEEYLKIASIVPTWAKGLPLSVAGWKGERFRK
jgi:DNA polymerase